MKDGPTIAAVAALLGDPARANMLTALMDGRALTVSELANAAGVALPTASEHLSKLGAAGLLVAEKQGRHRYFRLSGPDVAHVLESLMGLAQRVGQTRVRTGPRDTALRTARVCYDHLAGEMAVAMLAGVTQRGWIEAGPKPHLTPAGRLNFASLGVDMSQLDRGRRPVCRYCLDWSERKSHLGGALGSAVLQHILAAHWAHRGEGRVVTFSAAGAKALASTFGPSS